MSSRTRTTTLAAFALVLAACGGGVASSSTASVTTAASTTVSGPSTSAAPTTGSQAASTTETSALVATTKAAGPPPPPATPERIEFTVSDGTGLVGYYFPGATNPSPLVVLMHWARGDQRDWTAIAPWLQNRDLESDPSWRAGIGADCGDQMQGPWLDPNWFPPMRHDVSFGVFIFDFRDFCESDPGLADPSEWALDAQAAVDTAAALDGVDRHRIATAGASIGADGSPDGGVLHNRGAATVIGALSWSPGDYLMGQHYDLSFAASVTELDESEPPVPVWCFAAEGDGPAAVTCRSAGGDEYFMRVYPADAHGMQLITPEFEPNALVSMLDWLELVFDVRVD